ncbi:MAG: TPR Domain containing protein [Parcubacteria group bacterium Athens0714_25]|nr:MAG: TPR Domain containing protein [Parcubacteria group bacterium Athens0714_25]
MEIKVNKIQADEGRSVGSIEKFAPSGDGRMAERTFSPKIEPGRGTAAMEMKKDDGKNEGKKFFRFFGNISDKVIGLSIFMIFFGIPLFFTGITFQGMAFEKQIYFYFWLLIGLVAWLAKSIKTGEMRIRKTPLDIPILLFWAAYLASLAFSVDRWHSFFGFFGDPSRGFLAVTAFVVAYYFFFSHIGKKRIKLALGAIVGGGTLASVWTIIRLLDLQIFPKSVLENSPISLLGSFSGLNIFLGAFVVLVAGAILKTASSQEAKKANKAVLISLLFVALFSGVAAFVLIQDFTFWPAILVGSGIFSLYAFSRVIKMPDRWIWLPMTVFVLFLAIFMVGSKNLSLSRVSLPAEVSLAPSVSWDIVKDGLKENVISGSGPATYGYAFSKFKPQDFNFNQFYDIRFYQGSGLLFEAVPTIGILGTIVLLLLVFSYLSVAVYLISREKDKEKNCSLSFLSASVILLLAILLSKASGPIVLLGYLISVMALLSIILESEAAAEYFDLSLKASPKYALSLAFVFVVLSSAIVFSFVFLGKVFASDALAGMAIKESRTNREKAVEKMQRAIALNPKEGRYYTRLGQEYLILTNEQAIGKDAKNNAATIKKYLGNSITLLNSGKELMGNDLNAVESLAQAYENAGLYVFESNKKALENYERAAQLDPKNPSLYAKMGKVRMTLSQAMEDGDEKKAYLEETKKILEKSIELKKDFSAGYYNLSLLEEQMGTMDESVGNMEKAVVLSPSDANVVFNLGRLYQKRGGENDLKKAEAIFKKILEINKDDVNTNFSLGLLYEKTNRADEAVNQYQKVVSLIEKGEQNEISQKNIEQIQAMIGNIQKGKNNNQSQPVEDGVLENGNQNIPSVDVVEGENAGPQ